MYLKLDDPNCINEYQGDIEVPELLKWYPLTDVFELEVFRSCIPDYGIVYYVEDFTNHKYYVGVTRVSLCQRFYRRLKSTKGLLDKAIKDLGMLRFRVCILKVCKVEELNQWEDYYIDSLNTLTPVGYNSCKSAYSENAGKRTRLSVDVVSALVAQDMNDVQIGDALNYSPKNIRLFRERHNIPPGKAVVCTDELPEKIFRLRSSGCKWDDIASSHNISEPYVKYIFYRYKREIGIAPIRTRPSNPVVKIDSITFRMLKYFPSVASADRNEGVSNGTTSYRIKNNVIIDGARFMYADDYMAMGGSITKEDLAPAA